MPAPTTARGETVEPVYASARPGKVGSLPLPADELLPDVP
jgi:hypothetical protein